MKPQAPSFEDVLIGVKQINSRLKVGTWDDPDMADPPDTDPGIKMVSVEGERLAVLHFDAPVPNSFFDLGPLANFLMAEPAKACAGHKSHYKIVPSRRPESGEDAAMLARAVTLLAAALCPLVSAVGVRWDDADQIVPPAVLEQALFVLSLPAGGAAPVAWVRLFARADGGQLIVGTHGLYAFGHREIEVGPSDQDGNELLALTASEVALTRAHLNGKKLVTPQRIEMYAPTPDNPPIW